jgi:rhodanese-related sulfurtransferase
VQRLNAQELKERLGAAEPPLVLDVREPWEVQVCALPGAKHIPMRDVPTRLAEIERDRDLVVLCHHGVRSMAVANFLVGQGYARIYNLDGGIDAWAKHVEPGMAKY